MDGNQLPLQVGRQFGDLQAVPGQHAGNVVAVRLAARRLRQVEQVGRGGGDLHDGATFERFLDEVDHHPRAKILYDPSHLLLQQMDYLGFIDRYHARIGIFHVKDAEHRPSASSGVYGGYQDWIDRPGRFRSPGDGQIDFKAIFSKFAQYDFPGWAVLEWECCLKHPEDGAREGAAFIRDHLIRVTERAFDDFADSGTDAASLHRMLGI